jgi:peptide/nickel transport system substrate-binding protein
MARGMTRREFAAGAGGATLALSALGGRARAANDATTLRFIAQSDLRILDPIWTTAYVTRNHGYMIFDTLFALDNKFQPHPQMVGDYNISPDKLLYSFILRDGLKFHDGQPVRGIDCTTSLTRWMARDSWGQTLAGENRRDEGRRRQDLLDPTQGALSTADQCDLKGIEFDAVHHARAACQNRPL